MPLAAISVSPKTYTLYGPLIINTLREGIFSYYQVLRHQTK